MRGEDQPLRAMRPEQSSHRLHPPSSLMEILTYPCALILRAFAWSSFDHCGADAISRGLSHGESLCLSPALQVAASNIKVVDTEQKKRLFMARKDSLSRGSIATVQISDCT